MGRYRVMANVAEAMQENLGDKMCDRSEKEVEAALRRSGTLKYYVDKGDEQAMSRT